ncbi:hypothetical protein BGZ99_009494 [Dissophora globulifera]|uniref:Arrestin C-terminal-like domain-containing protein n=1 Tax=Dissophora globulifera TaxID=979702 RepID=A0A9P6UZ13_9FUNG|nr:hypothetical protein BGZ99_009494 [Dissophora globulifera]
MQLLGGKSTKTLSILIDHDPQQLGPRGLPLFYATPENPVVITGEATFETDHDCKGGDMQIECVTLVKVEWSDKAGFNRFSYGSGTAFNRKKVNVGLKHSATGSIKTGRYRAKINFPVAITTPSSATLQHAYVVYKIEARIPRRFPASDIVQEQLVWVVNSNITEATRCSEKLQACFLEEVLDDKDDYYIGTTEEVDPQQKSWVHTFNFIKTDDAKGAATPVVPTGPPLTCKVPTTTFMAGETVAFAVESAPPPGSFDVQSVSSSSTMLPRCDAAVYHPEIAVCIKQSIFYHDEGGTATLRDHREFACVFHGEIEQDHGGNLVPHREVFHITLPSLLEDSPDGLKPSVECHSLNIKHLLKVNVMYKDNSKRVRKFKIPITITSAPSADPLQFRFSSEWSSPHQPGALKLGDIFSRGAMRVLQSLNTSPGPSM